MLEREYRKKLLNSVQGKLSLVLVWRTPAMERDVLYNINIRRMLMSDELLVWVWGHELRN